MTRFTTHDKRTVTGESLQAALDKVADDCAQLGRDIYAEDTYADHVTQDVKNEALWDMLNHAVEIRNGSVNSFTIWQRVNEELTGECVALLP